MRKDAITKKRDEDLGAIKRLAENWRAGWLSGDADLLLSLWADEPILMPQDQPAVFGKDAIRSMYRLVFAEYDFQSESALKEVEASGDWGYFWSTYTLKAIPKAGGEPISSSGKSIFIVKREPGGDWKIARLMDNSDGGCPGVEAR